MASVKVIKVLVDCIWGIDFDIKDNINDLNFIIQPYKGSTQFKLSYLKKKMKKKVTVKILSQFFRYTLKYKLIKTMNNIQKLSQSTLEKFPQSIIKQKVEKIPNQESHIKNMNQKHNLPTNPQKINPHIQMHMNIHTQTEKKNEQIRKGSEDEGFQQKEYLVEIKQVVLASARNVKNAKNKKKVVLKNPFCIYDKIDLYTYNSSLDNIPNQINLSENYNANITTKEIQQNQQSKLMEIQQRNIDCKKMKTKILHIKRDIKQNKQKNIEIAHNSQPYARITEFVNNNKMVCVYNRHAQIITNKNDLTIYIKNIKTTVQADMLRGFQRNINFFSNTSNFNTRNEAQLSRRGSNNLNIIKVYSKQKQREDRLQSTSIQQLKSKSQSLQTGNNIINNITQFYSKYKISEEQSQNYGKLQPQFKVKLQFFSNFESGNLQFVFKEYGTDNYYLFLQNDINTHGYNQWFNFWVKAHISENTLSFESKENVEKKCRTYRPNFIIVNISKDIKYNQSMNILSYSFATDEWHNNTPFLYYKNKYERYNGMNYMTIQFEYDFVVETDESEKKIGDFVVEGVEQEKKIDDFVQFSLSFPYTYTKLMGFLKEITLISSIKWNIQIESISKSQCNNQIYLIKLIKKQSESIKNSQIGQQTQPQSQTQSQTQTQINKKCVLVLARQHPGQPASSYICQQLIKTIINSTIEIQQQYYDWFFIPMGNPDGVIHGNSRTNLKGYDINRCWDKNNLFLSVQVESVNNFIVNLKNSYHISYLIDLHGHSKDFDAFAYFSESNQKNQILNFLLSEKCSFFNYYKSKFGISYKKRPTFRGQMFYRQQIKNSITIQTSLFGFMKSNQRNESLKQKQKSSEIIPFTNKDYKQLADSIYNVLIQYQSLKQLPKEKQRHKYVNKSMQTIRKQVLSKINQLEKLRSQLLGKNEDSSVDSDSDPEDQYLQSIERINLEIENLQKNQEKESDQQEQAHLSSSNINLKTKVVQSDLQKNNRKQKLNERYSGKNFKTKRKPIYTNSNVEILSVEKLIQYEKSFKKYSMDQSNQFLSRKRLVETPQKLQVKNQRAQSSNHQQNLNQNLANKTKNISLHSNRKLMKSQPILLYPTVCNVKYNIEKVLQFQEKDVLYQSTKDWIMNQKYNMADYKMKIKQKNSKSIDQKNKTTLQNNRLGSSEKKYSTLNDKAYSQRSKVKYNIQSTSKDRLKNIFTSTGTAIQQVKRQKNYTSGEKYRKSLQKREVQLEISRS